ncbi:nitronate monooxygenase [Solwaraspora sp. WMMD406]|uniref:NAD(P)H-dependent flavin oxidoreductase n=1 Tax=Solwaraspora sp. WMMD406 TaxID=3016095 RepID=UPI002415BD66|nr:nitronate monooxygenase [Solwaraspora sp. WMMD406]MDG4765026.1 nitronate monooxygenase [Solwaraspora sp. WMMD406]
MGAVARQVFADLPYPIVSAPMAGGMSTPRLVSAVSAAGGLGFLAAGYRTPDDLRQDIDEVRAAVEAPFGVNLFVPGERNGVDPAVAAYTRRLAAEADRYDVVPGEMPIDHTDGWDEKLDLLVRERVPVVSFTFGCPSRAVVDRLHEAGSTVLVTVTSADEALIASREGADAVCVQGTEAGGHRGSFLPVRPGAETPGLLPLLASVRAAVPDMDIVAAGGIMDGAGIAAALSAGARAAQLGTAFLRTPESGAHPAYKSALVRPPGDGTAVTWAFSGRPARGLRNRFIAEYGAHAPMAYPDVHFVTAPIRRAATRAGDVDAMALWAGQGHRLARDLPAAVLVETLVAEARQAVRSVGDRLEPSVAAEP